MLRRIALGLVAALIALVGAAFLIVAFYRWLVDKFPPTLAAAIVGGAMIVIAIALLLLASRRRKEPGFAPEDLALAVLGFTSRAARSHPEKALIAAVLAGVLEEWLDTKPDTTPGPK